MADCCGAAAAAAAAQCDSDSPLRGSRSSSHCLCDDGSSLPVRAVVALLLLRPNRVQFVRAAPTLSALVRQLVWPRAQANRLGPFVCVFARVTTLQRVCPATAATITAASVRRCCSFSPLALCSISFCILSFISFSFSFSFSWLRL